MAIADILADHPHKGSFDLAELNRAIHACLECSAACSLCADTDLARDPSGMADCIRRCLDCADICALTARILARPTPNGDTWERVVAMCAAACADCAAECEGHDHICCEECAAACRACEKACQQLIAAAKKTK